MDNTQHLQAENSELRRRLEEAEEIIEAIRRGSVDAFLIQELLGERVYTLETADRPYRLFVEQAQQGAATLLPDGTIAYCNRRLTELLLGSYERLLGASLLGFVAPEDHALYQELLSQGQTRSGQGEAHLKRTDGVLVPVYLTFNALPDGCGGAIGVLITDLTAQKHHEQLTATLKALRQSEERFRLMANTTPAVIWTADPSGAITFHSQRWLDYTGLTPKDSADWTRRVLHPDDYERYTSAWAHALSSGNDYEMEARTRRHDGEYRWFLTRATPIRDASGQITEWYGSTTDIHDQKQAEAALSLSEERFRRAATAAGALVYEVDLLRSSHAYAYGLERLIGSDGLHQELASPWWHQRIHPEDLPGHLSFLEACLANPTCGHYRVTYRVRHTDGSWRHVDDTAQILRGLDGKAKQLVGIILDITERKRAEDALKEADRRKDDFLAMLSHELRNPLAPIRNAVRLLGLSSPKQPTLEIMERQVAHLARIVDDLLDVSRVSRGKIQLQKMPLELGAVIQQALETCSPLLNARQHKLTVKVPSAPIRVEGDFARLLQVASNLLNNAAKYTDEGGQLLLSLEEGEGAQAIIRVRDNGRGLDPRVLDRLFDLFYQVDRDLDRSEGGLGIGLSLVKSLVEMHGGRVRAYSAGRGQGSEFVVSLPRLHDGPKETPKAPINLPNARSLRILVVDDNLDSAESMSLFLEFLGHETLTAHDGKTAVSLALTERPSVVLLDIGLPKLNGYEACRAMRQGGLTDALIVAMTGYGQEDKRMTKEAGFDAYQVKPVDLSTLQKLLADR